MSWFGFAEVPPPPPPAPPIVASGSKICIAVLALRYGKQVGLRWAWACDAEKEYALGFALKDADPNADIVGRCVIEIPLAPALEALVDDATIDLSKDGDA